MQDELWQSINRGQNILADSQLSYLILYVNNLVASRAFYEGTLGLQLIEANEHAAKYNTGQTLLYLNRASDYGITLAAQDHSADLTFLVDDLDSTRAALEKRGVEFSETLRYEIGATVNFYDPDGHWFSLYEPSTVAMTWPSAEKIRTLLKTGSKGMATYGPPAEHSEEGFRLGGRKLIYLFLFVPYADEAFNFYHGTLGLQYLECGPCRRGSTDNERAVVKYDVGHLMLTTHHFDGKCPATVSRELTAAQMKGMALVFHVVDIELMVEALARKGVRAGGVVQAEDGRVAKFEDPFGRVFFLYQPSVDTLRTHGGAMPAQILEDRL